MSCIHTEKYARAKIKAKLRLELDLLKVQAEKPLLKIFNISSKQVPDYAARRIRKALL